MTLISLDFETFYDGDYSLKKMTMEEYIRHPLFEIIGFSLAIDSAEPTFYPGNGTPQQRAVLDSIDWSHAALVAHNCMFDGAILNWRLGYRPGMYICTGSMARWLVGMITKVGLGALAEFFNAPWRKGQEVVNAKGKRLQDFTPQELRDYANYCITDTNISRWLLRKMRPAIPASEMHLIDWTVRAFVEPMLHLNSQKLEVGLMDYQKRKHELLQQAGVHDVGALRSDDTMALALSALGVVPPMKNSPKRKNADGSPKRVYAFSKQDVEFVDLQHDPDERVAALVEARLGLKSSIVETRLQRFLGISRRGPLPIPTKFAGAEVTRRWAGTDDINPQNLPRNTKQAKSVLRDAIEAPPGFILGAPDLSQIELRTNCWHSGQHDVLDQLRRGEDVYASMASDIVGFKVNKKDHEPERFVGKTTVLGCGYQCGRDRFHKMLQVDSRKYGIKLIDSSVDFAARAVYTFRDKNPHVVRFWYAAQELIPKLAAGMSGRIGPYPVDRGSIILPNGCRMFYPELMQTLDPESGELQWTYSRFKYGRKIRSTLYGGKLVENITQAVARLFVSDALLRLDSIRDAAGNRVFHVVFSVHDELVVAFHESLDLEWVRQVFNWALTTNPPWAPDIPLDCEMHFGKSYADCK